MYYSDFYSLLLTEGSLEYVTKLLTNKHVESYLPRILELDPSKNFIVRLAQFFLEKPEEDHFVNVSNTFQTYLNQKKNQWWKGEPSDKNDIKKFATYEEFEIAVNNVEAKYSALKRVGKLDFYEKFLQLDPSKKHIAKLIEFFVDNPTNHQFDLIKADFEMYVRQQRNDWWSEEPKEKDDITKFDDFEDFSSIVHKIEAKYNPEHSSACSVVDRGSKLFVFGKYIDKSDVTYQSEDVVVVHAPNMTKSKQYGSGFSTWCTARESNNYFYSYRFGKLGGIGESSLYYVYFPKRCKANQNDETTVLHFGVNANGNISYTDRSNEEYNHNLNWLKGHFPEFKDVDMNVAFKYYPPTEAEKNASDLPDEISDAQFLALREDEKIIYLSTGERAVNLVKFESLSPILQDAWLKACDVEKSLFRMEIIRKYSNHKYIKKLFKWMQTASKYDVANTFNYLIRDTPDLDGDLQFFIQHGVNSNKILSAETIKSLIRYSEDKGKMINFVLSKNLPIDEETIDVIIDYIPQPQVDNTILTLLNKNVDLSYSIIYLFLREAQNKDKIISALLTKPIKFSDNIVSYFMTFAPNKRKMIAILLKQPDINIKSLWNIDDARETMINSINSRRLIMYLMQKGLKLEEIFTSATISEFVFANKNNFQSMIDLFVRYKIPLTSVFTENTINILLSNVAAQDSEKLIDKLLDKQYPLAADSIQWLLEYSNTDARKLKTIYKIIQSPAIPLSLEVVHAIISYCPYDSITSVIDQLFTQELSMNADDILHFFKKARDRSYDTNKLISKLLEHDAPFDEHVARIFLRYGANVNTIIEKCISKNISLEKVFDENTIELIAMKNGSEAVIDAILNSSIKLTQKSMLKLLENANDIAVVAQKLQANGFDINTILTPYIIYSLVTSYTTNRQCREKNIQFIIDTNVPLNADCVKAILEQSRLTDKTQLVYKLIERANTVLSDTVIDSMIKYLPAENRKAFLFNVIQKGIYMFEDVDILRQALSRIAADGLESFKEAVSFFLTKGMPMENIVNSDNIAFILNEIYKSQHESTDITEMIVFLIENQLSLSEYAVHWFFKYGDAFYTFETLLNRNLVPLNKLLNTNNISEIMSRESSDKTKLPRLFVEKQLPISEAIMSSFIAFASDPTANLHIVINHINLTYSMVRRILRSATEYGSLIKEMLLNGNIQLTPEITALFINHFDSITYYTNGYSYIVDIVNILLERRAPINTSQAIREILRLTGDKQRQNEIINILVTNYPLTTDMAKAIMDYAPDVEQALAFFLSKNLKINDIVDEDSINAGLTRTIDAKRQAIIDLLLDNNVTLTDYMITLFNKFSTNKEPTMQKIANLQAAQLAAKAQIQENDITYGDFYALLRENVFLFEGRKMVQNASLTPDIIKKILDIEKQAYPSHMQMMNHLIDRDNDGNIIYPSMEDITNYMDCKPHEMFVYVGNNWFILACNRPNEVEIVDWASVGGMTVNAVNAFLSILGQFKNKLITANCRETTSYAFIKKCEAKGYLEILQDIPNDWGNDTMHELKLKVKHTAPI